MEIDFGAKRRVLDGAMGTMLQKEGMEEGETTTGFGAAHPDILKKIHEKYIEAGADIIYAATFGINRMKLDELDMPLEEAMKNAVGAAVEAKREAFEKKGREVLVALDMGPLGELLEPMGTLSFEKAYDVFREMVILGERYGADIAVIETMTDLYEVKAAMLAVKENSGMPVMVSMTFEENGRTFTGVSLEAMAVTCEALGADAVGINCSLGPSEILPMAEKLMSLTSLPVFAKPNAGLPDPATGEYDITARMFADEMALYLDAGVDMIGGCCGTTEEYIALLAEERDAWQAQGKNDRLSYKHNRESDGKLRICSGTSVVTVDHVTVIGERINPTGKKRLKQALLEEDFEYIMAQAIEQAEAGAEVLDVNVGVPGVDDVKLLPAVVKKLQSVTDLPLQIDSSNPEAIEAALRVYNGKAIVNSVNGEDLVMESILPAVKKYGAAVIGLTLDENGIPDSAEGRAAIGERILKKAGEAGITRENVIIDCLALTASAQQKEVNETLRAVRMIKDLGMLTALGVSNISFGLPARNIINRTFLAMAMENGLDLPIINPNDEDMTAAVMAFNVLKNVDENAAKYIEKYGAEKKEERPASSAVSEDGEKRDIFYFIEKGMKKEAGEETKRLLTQHDELEIVNSFLIPALDNVGKGFEKGTIFLPQMLQAASAAQAGFEVIKASLAAASRETVSLGTAALATVKGDIHDIGKNIVKVIMENYGYEIIDLGRDVPAEKIVETVKAGDLKLIGLSALMTTTLKSMEETIKAVKEAAPQCRIMVGGAVLTAEYAARIGADFYCSDAMRSVEAAQEVFNEQI